MLHVGAVGLGLEQRERSMAMAAVEARTRAERKGAAADGVLDLQRSASRPLLATLSARRAARTCCVRVGGARLRCSGAEDASLPAPCTRSTHACGSSKKACCAEPRACCRTALLAGAVGVKVSCRAWARRLCTRTRTPSAGGAGAMLKAELAALSCASR